MDPIMQQHQQPMGGQMPMGDQMPQEEMRSNLLELYNKIKEKKGEWDATKNVGEARVAESKVKALGSFFDAFQKAGIDPSDPDAMREFFDRLYEQNPDLYEMIVPVIDSLLGPEGGQPEMGVSQEEPELGEVGP